MLEVCPPANDLESRVADYLKIMIGNMKVNELSLFLRFVTGASVCIVPTIKVEFNGLSGLGRRPIAQHVTVFWSYLHLILIMKIFVQNSAMYWA